MMPEPPFETPVQQLALPLFEERKLSVCMKRDDMIHPFISGNKWRKLKYVLAHAKETRRNHLVTFGGPYSNHLVALACAGALSGFKTTGFVRGEKVSNHMLTLCGWWGMDIRFVERSAYLQREELFYANFGNNPDAFFIDEGGKGELAAKGCAEILHGLPSTFTHAVCPVGTGTTLAGLALGASPAGMRVEGISVLKARADESPALEKDVRMLVPQLHNWTIHHRFHRGGYARADSELLDFIRSFAASTGILLDQVYTAKMVMGVEELAREEYFAPGTALLLVHTGGLLGLLSGWEHQLPPR